MNPNVANCGTESGYARHRARRDLDLNAVTRQIQARLRADSLGVGVIRPDGYGPATVAQWPVVMTLEQAVRLLKEAGYQ